MARYLSASSVVVRSYAAHALERILLMRDLTKERNPPMFGSAPGVLYFISLELSQTIFGGLIQNISTLNEYAIKAMMRSLLALREHAILLLPLIFPPLVSNLFEGYFLS